MKTRPGDLLALAQAGEFDVIAHGCNCFCRMGRGIALSIRELFPEAAAADKETVAGDRQKLGTCTTARITCGHHTFVIVNAYTQHHWEGVGVLADNEAIQKCMEWIKLTFPGKRIGLPKIGAGLARGDWNTIESIIEKALAQEDVTIIDFVPEWKSGTVHEVGDRVILYGELFTCKVPHTSDVFGNDLFEKKYWARHKM